MMIRFYLNKFPPSNNKLSSNDFFTWLWFFLVRSVWAYKYGAFWGFELLKVINEFSRTGHEVLFRDLLQSQKILHVFQNFDALNLIIHSLNSLNFFHLLQNKEKWCFDCLLYLKHGVSSFRWNRQNLNIPNLFIFFPFLIIQNAHQKAKQLFGLLGVRWNKDSVIWCHVHILQVAPLQKGTHFVLKVDHPRIQVKNDQVLLTHSLD